MNTPDSVLSDTTEIKDTNANLLDDPYSGVYCYITNLSFKGKPITEIRQDIIDLRINPAGADKISAALTDNSAFCNYVSDVTVWVKPYIEVNNDLQKLGLNSDQAKIIASYLSSETETLLFAKALYKEGEAKEAIINALLARNCSMEDAKRIAKEVTKITKSERIGYIIKGAIYLILGIGSHLIISGYSGFFFLGLAGYYLLRAAGVR